MDSINILHISSLSLHKKQAQIGKMQLGDENLQKDYHAHSVKAEKSFNEEAEMLMKAERDKELQRL